MHAPARFRRHLWRALWPGTARAARWLLVLCGLAGAAPAGAQSIYLEAAVSKLSESLVHQLRAKGRYANARVFVSPLEFSEERSLHNLPLSAELHERFSTELDNRGVTIELAEDSAQGVMVLQGTWRELSGEEGIRLTVKIRERRDGGHRLVASTDGRVERVDAALLTPDLESWGRYAVKRLERGLSGRRTVHIAPVSVRGTSQSEELGRYLDEFWLAEAFAQSRRFTRVEAGGESDGELRVSAQVVGGHLQISLRIVDGEGTQMAAATIRELATALLPFREDTESPQPPEFGAKASYEAADRVGTVAAYQEIVDSFSDTVYATLAREQIAKLQAQAREGFREAVKANDVVQVKVALDAGVNVDAKDGQNRNRTPLHDAAREGYADVVRLLLNAGADINVGDRDGHTPLHLAALGDGEDWVATVNALLESGADVNSRDDGRMTPLHYAWNDGEVARALIHGGADVNARDDDRYTPLHWASDDDVVWVLVEAGADLESRDTYGRTALNQAAGIDYENSNYASQLRALKALIEAGADVNARDDSGATPLHDGALYDNADVVKALIEAGARVNVRDGDDDTPLGRTDSYEVKELLRAAGGRR